MILAADRVIFGDSGKAPAQTAVCVQDGKIAAIAPLEELKARFPDQPVRERPGCSLLPGLIDMHTHAGLDGAPDSGSFDDHLRALCGYARLHGAIRAGVTTVRDVGSPDGQTIALKRAQARGFIPETPRLLTADRGICMTGGHGADFALECDGEWEVRKGVRLQIKKGADWIKVLTSEGLRGQELSQEELNAAVDECRRFGIPCAAHAGWKPSVDMCVKAGFDTIEHGTTLTVELAKIMRENNQTWTPTIIAFTYIADRIKAGETYLDAATGEYILNAADMYRQNFKKLYDTGVRVVCGTDMVMYGAPTTPVAREAQYMVEYGITPLQAIEAATKNGADALRLGQSLGQIQEGYIADLLIVEGNPAEDIKKLACVREVYRDGRRLYRAD